MNYLDHTHTHTHTHTLTHTHTHTHTHKKYRVTFTDSIKVFNETIHPSFFILYDISSLSNKLICTGAQYYSGQSNKIFVAYSMYPAFLFRPSIRCGEKKRMTSYFKLICFSLHNLRTLSIVVSTGIARLNSIWNANKMLEQINTLLSIKNAWFVILVLNYSRHINPYVQSLFCNVEIF